MLMNILQSGSIDIFSILYLFFYFANYPLLIILGIILIVKRFKLKPYPFIIIVWIYPVLEAIHLFILTSYGGSEFMFGGVWMQIIIAILPAVIITVLSIVLRKKDLKDQVSIRVPKPALTFPIERELIFISYATADSPYFQIPKLTKILASYPEIDEILYWESDMHDDIYRYMDTNLKRCKIVLLFCSKNSLYSEAVNMEWSSALKLDKKIIPVFNEPDDIPALLTTKLGVHFNKDDPYQTIEEIYKMILKKLEIESVREYTKYILPKWITLNDFNEMNVETVEESNVFDSDIPSNTLGKQIATILQNNNFYVPDLESEKTKKKPKKNELIVIGDAFNMFTCFAELKDDPEDIALSVKIQRVSDTTNKVFLTLRGRREWVLKELLKDIDSKLLEMKSKTELLRNYSGKIISLLQWIPDIERFLRRHLASNIKYIEDTIEQLNRGDINNEEFVIKGTQLLGKNFISVFINNIPLILKEKKKFEEKKSSDQAPLSF
ncbi:MAG: toll/interleukin-1 receptor domain-containing protein [Candidatus Hermodarchaeota archaeon]